MKYVTTFVVTVETEVSDELVKEALSPEWQKDFYKFSKAQDVADHLAYNFARNNTTIQSLDGFAHLTEKDGSMVKDLWETET